MKLITEITEDIEYITEAKEDGKKNLYIEGIFLQSAIKNRNGRIYPEGVMDKEVARYMKESVDRKTAVGELNHPPSPSINLDRVSHRIVSLKKEGTNYIGKALITSTPMGNIVKGLMESGVQLGVSSRGMGTLKPNKQGINEVQEDFRLVTAADVVSDPSAPSAWVNGIMENVDWIYDDKMGWKSVDIVEAIVSETKGKIELAIREKMLQERKIQLFENFMTKISKHAI